MLLRYTPRVFLRQAPNRLLRRYFENKGWLGEIPWDGLKETKIEPLHQAIMALPEVERREIGRDFRAMSDLTSPRAAALLARVAKDRGVVMPRPESDRWNVHERALWLFLEHRLAFDEAQNAARWELLPRGSMDKRNGLPMVAPDTSPEALQRLADAVSQYYRDEQGRGEHCRVEHFPHKGYLDYFFAYPADYLNTMIGYEEDGEFARKDWKPAFEVVLAFDRTAGTVELCAEGGARIRGELAVRFARTVLGAEEDPVLLPAPQYSLQALLNRDFAFPTMPEENLDLVRVKTVRVRWPGHAKRFITFDVDGRDVHVSIHDLVSEVVAGSHTGIDDLQVTGASLQAIFSGPHHRRRSLLFDISLPSHCSLGDSPEELSLKECLKRWGIDVSAA